MATKLYTLENLLVGKNYRSRNRHFQGEIVSATPRPEIWYGENNLAYTIEVKPTHGLSYQYATIAVKIGE